MFHFCWQVWKTDQKPEAMDLFLLNRILSQNVEIIFHAPLLSYLHITSHTHLLVSQQALRAVSPHFRDSISEH